MTGLFITGILRYYRDNNMRSRGERIDGGIAV
jgi:hypothetical protein